MPVDPFPKTHPALAEFLAFQKHNHHDELHERGALCRGTEIDTPAWRILGDCNPRRLPQEFYDRIHVRVSGSGRVHDSSWTYNLLSGCEADLLVPRRFNSLDEHRRATRRCRPKVTHICTNGLLHSRCAWPWRLTRDLISVVSRTELTARGSSVPSEFEAAHLGKTRVMRPCKVSCPANAEQGMTCIAANDATGHRAVNTLSSSYAWCESWAFRYIGPLNLLF